MESGPRAPGGEFFRKKQYSEATGNSLPRHASQGKEESEASLKRLDDDDDDDDDLHKFGFLDDVSSAFWVMMMIYVSSDNVKNHTNLWKTNLCKFG